MVSCQTSYQPEPFDLADVLTDPCYETASISFAVYDLEGDSIITEYEPETALPPASTQKILTTAAALLTLGGEFEFETDVQIAGAIEDSTLKGDLIIRGFGDPALGSSHFVQDGFEGVFGVITQMLRQAGIHQISGDIIGDAGYYSPNTIPRSWPFQHLGNYYGAFATGLNFFDNQFFLKFQQRSNPGEPIVDLTIEPGVPGLTIRSYVKSGPPGSGDEAYIMGAPFQTNRYVQGTIPPGNGLFTIRGSLPDPALFLTYHLKNYFETNGIQVNGTFRSSYGAELKTNRSLGIIRSPSLSEIVTVTNQKSVNLFAEALGLRSMKNYAMDTDDWLLDFWKEKGIETSGCHFYDFAGLAQDNALNARTMLEILRYTYHERAIWPLFLRSLAVAGEQGTLRSMFRGTAAKGKVYAKSGLINGVRSYAGYMESSSGKWYAFDLMTYNPDCDSGTVRRKLENWMEKLYIALP